MTLKRIAKYSVLALGLWFVVHTGYSVIDGLRDGGGRADLAVVLGNTVRPDGTLSERLGARLGKGLELYRAGRVRRLLVSGGLGREGHQEAERMRQYYRERGVPDSALITDNDGYNSEATVINTLRLRDSLGFGSVIVVSQYFHITRCKHLFRRHGFSKVSGAAPAYFEWRDLYAVPHEFLAYYAG